MNADPQAVKEMLTGALKVLLHLTFPTIVLTISLKVPLREFLAELRRPALFLKILVVGSLLVPYITAGLLRLFDLPLVVLGIVLVASVAPGDSFALLEAQGKKGKISLAAATMAWLCLAMPFTVPAWMALFSRWFPLNLKVGAAGLFATIAPLTLLPLLAGLLLSEYAPKFSARLHPVAKQLSRFLLLAAVVAGLALGVKGFAHFTLPSVTAVFLATTVALLLGYYCGGADRSDRISMGLTSSLGNFAVIILVAHLSYPQAHVLKESAAFVIVRWCVIMFWFLFLRLRLRLRGESL